MITFMDMCFCGNKDCNKRRQCKRALENYSKEEKDGHYFTMANFDCANGKNMFIKISRKR